MIVVIMLVGVVVTNNVWVLEPHRIPIDAPFSLIATYLQGSICCHQHHGVIWLLNSVNMKVVAINYFRNLIIIAYLLPIKVLLCRISINIIWPVHTVFITSAAKHPTLIYSMISCGIKKFLYPEPMPSLIPKFSLSA